MIQAHVHAVVSRFGAHYDQKCIYDQVKYLISTICSEHTSHELAISKFNLLDDMLLDHLRSIQKEWHTNVQIVNVRVYKPLLPKSLAAAYQQQATERALKKAKVEELARITQENLNKQEITKGRLEREAAENEAEIAKQISSKRGEAKKKEIENQIKLGAADTEAQRIRKLAEANAYAVQQLAEANAQKHTPRYLELKKYEAMLHSAKIIGDPAKVLLSLSSDGHRSKSSIVAMEEAGAFAGDNDVAAAAEAPPSDSCASI